MLTEGTSGAWIERMKRLRITSATSRLVRHAWRSRILDPIIDRGRSLRLVKCIACRCSNGWKTIVDPLPGTGVRWYAHTIRKESLLLACNIMQSEASPSNHRLPLATVLSFHKFSAIRTFFVCSSDEQNRSSSNFSRSWLGFLTTMYSNPTANWNGFSQPNSQAFADWKTRMTSLTVPFSVKEC